jgi:uncharacterized membrane protein (UPF0136 family)
MTALARIVLLLYGIALIVGGIIGYTKGGSQESLIWGAGSGAVAVLAFFISLKSAKLGFAIGFLVAAAVGYRMYMQYTVAEAAAKNRTLGIAIASLVTLIVLLAGMLLGRRRQKA